MLGLAYECPDMKNNFASSSVPLALCSFQLITLGKFFAGETPSTEVALCQCSVWHRSLRGMAGIYRRAHGRRRGTSSSGARTLASSWLIIISAVPPVPKTGTSSLPGIWRKLMENAGAQNFVWAVCLMRLFFKHSTSVKCTYTKGSTRLAEELGMNFQQWMWFTTEHRKLFSLLVSLTCNWMSSWMVFGLSTAEWDLIVVWPACGVSSGPVITLMLLLSAKKIDVLTEKQLAMEILFQGGVVHACGYKQLWP